MIMLGGLFIGCFIGFGLGAWLMRQRIKEGLRSAVSRPAFIEIMQAFNRGDA